MASAPALLAAFGELYDLDEDPDELRNLDGDEAHRPIRGELAERLMHWYGATRHRISS